MDIRTLAMILGITSIVQVIVFALLASIDKTYRGIGWWLLWSVSAAAGFVFILLRAIPAIHKASIIAQNALLILGVIFLNIGIIRFLEKKERRGILAAIFITFFSFLLYFTYVKDNIAVRTVAIGVALAVVSFLTAWELYAHKLPSVKASANFIAAFFLAHGAYFILRSAAVLAGADVSNMFRPSLFNVSAYLDAIIVSIIWTCGLIIMVSQRSNAEMAEATKHFELIFNTAPDAAVITRLDDGTIVDINHGFSALTGLSREDAIGKSNLAIPVWKNPADRQTIIAELHAKGFSDNFEAEFLRKDGSQLTGLMSAKAITLRGSPHIISVTRDISERKEAEENIKRQLAEKEILLKEVHHRIKNNITAIGSIISLNLQAIRNQEAIAVLQDVVSRINSMRILYDKLLLNESYIDLSVKDYIESLAHAIILLFPDRANVTIEKRIDDFHLDAKQLFPLGVILNELLTNTMKYAFSNRETGVIEILLIKTDRHVTLAIQDDGNGLPEGFAINESKGFGLMLVKMLSQQLGGNFSIERHEGTRCKIEFDI
jgi:PAS domain S-box-containing protein